MLVVQRLSLSLLFSCSRNERPERSISTCHSLIFASSIVCKNSRLTSRGFRLEGSESSGFEADVFAGYSINGFFFFSFMQGDRLSSFTPIYSNNFIDLQEKARRRYFLYALNKLIHFYSASQMRFFYLIFSSPSVLR